MMSGAEAFLNAFPREKHQSLFSQFSPPTIGDNGSH